MINRRDFLQASLAIAVGSSMPLLSSASFFLDSDINDHSPKEPTLSESLRTQKSERRADIRSLDFDSHEFDLNFRKTIK